MEIRNCVSCERYYYYIRNGKSWSEAQKYCQATFRGDLLDYSNIDVSLLYQHVPNATLFWTGYHTGLSDWIANQGCFPANSITGISRKPVTLKTYNAAYCQSQCKEYQYFALKVRHQARPAPKLRDGVLVGKNGTSI
ncbi:hypothetical protein KP79_PYT04598 [Mizuhopecten yessoensis]|uniref:C-type lectin domain-containing protein n=1 Tax=Mizuhopecten yessoensis TaxID=6573 RepID=A0A210QX29_MIZYE|nr:hypothetical protein KP79_PYT04598 [Mizuhopecten yessoensis]